MPTDPQSRGRFVAFLAGSPLLAAAGLDARALAPFLADRRGHENTGWQFRFTTAAQNLVRIRTVIRVGVAT
jgi:hypothetical protein